MTAIIASTFTGPEIEIVRNWSGLHAEIRSDEHYFTVYDKSGKPAGTINRPRYNSDGMWEVANLDGEIVKRCIGPRTCLIALRRHLGVTDPIADVE